MTYNVQDVLTEVLFQILCSSVALCNLRSGVMEWSRGVEWSGVWSGVESTLNSCNVGRAFEMQFRN